MSSSKEQYTFQVEEPPRLQDYQLEKWLASAHLSPSLESLRSEKYSWTQRVQYAVGHAVNRYYSAEPKFRIHTNSGELVDYRWPQRLDGFDSEKKYWELKDQVIVNLNTFFQNNPYTEDRPILLYEQLHTHVAELGLDLSMIAQVAWQCPKTLGIHLQKFVVEDKPQVLDGYRHVARVFCRHAFGADPIKLEVFHVLEGKITELSLGDISYEQSLDYLKLAYQSIEESNGYTLSS
ncbi:hypothetical protein [Saccharibacillus sp. JS10]|uniref:hypothetical protein n=1 Tax=Saccharibacillus sp. JS10 TaxID=2950552 RepID=UPI00210BA30F|nr:hypothetical protein [Saccharibacillus sp. JS10]MCQ4085725.1 hypothetical protein [Saccharibacillus sp. JS10]